MKNILSVLAVVMLVCSPALAVNYYWVGGSGTWSDYTNHWATASGGTSFHAQAPTQNDNVYFDANSFPSSGATVTVNAAAYCADMDWTGAANNPAFAGTTAQTIYIYGSLKFIPGMNVSYLGTVYFESLSTGKTITMAGQTFKRNVYFNGIGGWILQDAFSQTGSYTVYLNNGTLDLNNQAFTVYTFNSNNTNVRTMWLRSSTFTLTSASGSTFYFRGENFTFNAGTSLVRFTGAGAGMNHYSGYGPGLAFYNVVFEAVTGTSSADNVNGSFNELTFNSNGSITGGNVINTITFAGNGSINTNGNNVTTAQFNSGATINGNGTYGQVTIAGNGSITGNNTIGTLVLTAGRAYTFTAARTQLITNNLTASGTCATPITLQSSTGGSQTSFSKSSGTVSIDYCIMKDINASGGATFTATNTIDLGNNTGWTILPPAPLDLYWVGGSGNWNDPAHWSSSSGGTGGYCIPSALDNVFFDANSFTSGSQSVTLVGDGNGLVSCKNMNWTGVTNNPTLAGASSVTLKIYGSLTLSANMVYSFSGPVYFVATTTGHTIFSGGLLLDNNDLYFQGPGGGWNLQDGLNLGSQTLYLISGSLNTNNQPVSASIFYSNYTSTRSLTLGSTTLTLTSTSGSAFYFRGENFTFNAGTSLITFTGAGAGMNHYSNLGPGLAFNNVLFQAVSGTSTADNGGGSFNLLTFNSNGNITGGNTIDTVTVAGTATVSTNGNNFTTAVFNGAVTLNGNGTYGQVTMNGNGAITGNNTFGILVFATGKQYTLTSGRTQILTNDLLANGTSTQLIVIKSSTTGSQSTFSKASGTVTVNYVTLQDNNATGGATFIANNSIDMGNNTGWIINSTSGQDLYWVGGTGNWTDAGHWSLTSGGTGGAGVPTVLDNVFFDANSFSAAGQVVTLTGDASNNARALNMDWTGAGDNPTLAGASTVNLRINGSLILNPNMTFTFAGPIYMEATETGKTVYTGGLPLGNNHLYFQGEGGGWTLQDGLNLGGKTLYLVNGTLNTNNQPVNAGVLNTVYTNTRSISLGSSVVTLTTTGDAVYFRGENLTFDAGTSLIRMTGAGADIYHYGPYGPGVAFHDVTCEATSGTISISNSGGSFHDLTISSNVSISGGNTINSFTVAGTATISSNDNNFTTAVIGSTATINGNGTYGHITLNGNGSITGNNTFGTLVFTTANQYTLTSGRTQILTDDLIANGTETQLIIIKSSTTGSQSTFSKASGTVTVNYVSLQDNNATGGATFIANNSIDLGNNTGWIINAAGGKDYYWVGGTGNWTDAGHWSLTSGGTGGAGVPTVLDNVFFDANSFSATGQVVTVIGDASNNARVLNMDWTGAANNPTLAGASTVNLRINGSLTLIPDMGFTFAGPVYFEATETGKTIYTGGVLLNNNSLYFQGPGGEWTLLDALNLGSKTLYLISGSLNTNDQPVNAFQFNSYYTSARSISLGSSVVTLTTTGDAFYFRGENFTFTAGTSLIRFTGAGADLLHVGSYGPGLAFYDVTCEATSGTNTIDNSGGSFHDLTVGSDVSISGGNTINTFTVSGNATISSNGNNFATAVIGATATINGDGTYGQVTLNGSGNITGNNTFATLEFTPGNTYTLTYGKTQTLLTDLVVEGTCFSPITITSNSTTYQSTLSKTSDTVVINQVSLQGINATGGAVFIANNAIDLGNNTGWIINASGVQDLYWVGGTGNWDDVSHWASESGGAGGYCVPSQLDNAFFDANSFTQTGQAVYINVSPAVCRDMDWSAAAFSPTFTSLSNTYALHIYGSLKLSTAMNFAFSGPVYFKGTTTKKESYEITLAGNSFQNDVYFDGDGGSWMLMDAFDAGNNYLYLDFGTLNSNNMEVTCNRFISSNNNARALNMGSSIFNILNNTAAAWYVSGANCTVIPGTSEIRLASSNGGFLSTGTGVLNYYGVLFQNPGGSSTLNSDDQIVSVVFNPAGIVTGSGTFGHVVFYGSGEIQQNNSFEKVEFLNNGTIKGSNTFDTLYLSPGKTYQMEQGKTQTVNGLFDAWGNSCAIITLKSTSTGNQATISKATGLVEGNYIDLQDLNATGGATFNLYNSLDLGNNTGWNFPDPPGDVFNIKVWLQGPFNGVDMNASLTAFLPTTQPYNASPWNYTNCEHFTGLPPANVVDWILVELRDAPSAATATSATMIDRQAALLMKDGSIKRTDGLNPVIFDVTPVNNLYMIIWQRNHLAVMSANPLVNTGGVYNYDFSTGANQVYGGSLGHKEIATGIWGMISGDGDANKQVNNADKNDVWKLQAGTSGYKAGDFDMNAQVNNNDKIDQWKPNSGRSSQVPN
jgi:hypothetical protein